MVSAWLKKEESAPTQVKNINGNRNWLEL